MAKSETRQCDRWPGKAVYYERRDSKSSCVSTQKRKTEPKQTEARKDSLRRILLLISVIPLRFVCPDTRLLLLPFTSRKQSATHVPFFYAFFSNPSLFLSLFTLQFTHVCTHFRTPLCVYHIDWQHALLHTCTRIHKHMDCTHSRSTQTHVRMHLTEMISSEQNCFDKNNGEKHALCDNNRPSFTTLPFAHIHSHHHTIHAIHVWQSFAHEFISILGMNLFGCKFCYKTRKLGSEEEVMQCDRKNFDSLLWALVTVFQVRFSGSSIFLCILLMNSPDNSEIGTLASKYRLYFFHAWTCFAQHWFCFLLIHIRPACVGLPSCSHWTSSVAKMSVRRGCRGSDSSSGTKKLFFT